MIRFGTCSWKYDSWRGILYSDEVNINYLKEYSSHYSTVEIDQWFWSLYAPVKVVIPNQKQLKIIKDLYLKISFLQLKYLIQLL